MLILLVFVITFKETMEVFHEVLQSVRSSRKQLSDRTVKILKEVKIDFVFPNRLHIFNMSKN